MRRPCAPYGGGGHGARALLRRWAHLSGRPGRLGDREPAMSTVDLSTRLGGLSLPSPVMVASGCGGTGRDLTRFGSFTRVGAFVTGSVTREGSGGRALPRFVEVP